MNGRVRLGSWAFPSGNSVDVFLGPGAARGPRDLFFEWDDPPPLCPADLRFYQLVVLPKVTRLVAEDLDRPGPALVVQA